MSRNGLNVTSPTKAGQGLVYENFQKMLQRIFFQLGSSRPSAASSKVHVGSEKGRKVARGAMDQKGL